MKRVHAKRTAYISERGVADMLEIDRLLPGRPNFNVLFPPVSMPLYEIEVYRNPKHNVPLILDFRHEPLLIPMRVVLSILHPLWIACSAPNSGHHDLPLLLRTNISWTTEHASISTEDQILAVYS